MSNYDQLRLKIQNSIKGNGSREITGFLLQDVLLYMVDVISEGLVTDTILGNIDTEMSATSRNAVENRVIKAYADKIATAAENLFNSITADEIFISFKDKHIKLLVDAQGGLGQTEQGLGIVDIPSKLLTEYAKKKDVAIFEITYDTTTNKALPRWLLPLRKP